GMRRAITAPMPPPTARPAAIRPTVAPDTSCSCASVVAMAIVMPIMPNRVPRRELSGLERPRSAMMNSTPENRYSSATRFAFMSQPPRSASALRLLLLVHGQHALGDEEAAEDVHGGHDQG